MDEKIRGSEFRAYKKSGGLISKVERLLQRMEKGSALQGGKGVFVGQTGDYG